MIDWLVDGGRSRKTIKMAILSSDNRCPEVSGTCDSGDGIILK